MSISNRRSSASFVTILLTVFATTALHAADANYTDGIKACDAGQYSTCDHKMKLAVKAAPRSSNGYTPYYYLGLAAYNQGNAPFAYACFEKEAAFGQVQFGANRSTFNSLRAILAERPELKAAAASAGVCTVKPATERPPPHTASAVAVAERIALLQAMETQPDWAVHYEAGQAACGRADWENCKAAMDSTIRLNPRSAASLPAGRKGAYTPHYYAALSAFNLQDELTAMQLIQKEAEAGIIQKSDAAGAYQTLLRVLVAEPMSMAATAPNPAATGAMPGDSEPAPAPAVESPAEPAGNSTNTERDPAGAQADYVKGVSLILAEKFAEAAPYFESALRKDPRQRQYTRSYGMWFEAYIPHYYLASCYYQLGRFADAREHIRLSQDREMRGRLTDQKGQLLNMSETIDKKEATGQPALLYNMGEGIMRLVSGDYDRAAIVFEFLTQASPRWAEAHLYLGVTYFAMAQQYREKKRPGDIGRAEDLEKMARKELKAARKHDHAITLSGLMLSPALTAFWNQSVN